MVSARRINEVLAKSLSLEFPETETNIINDKNIAISFDNVSFKYPEAEDYVLENINFTIKEGETVAFIGATGSGKSTILKLIVRNYDATKGKVNISGKDVKVYTESEIAKKIGYALQKATLLSGSIASNIAFGKEDTMGELKNIEEAAELAQAEEFISKTEKTYEHDIAQGGSNLSGGQRQRISIARTLFRKPDILIFDDSFSALDYKTDRRLRDALKKEYKSKTKIIVAQRVSTIMDADKIIVLDEGEIVGSGTHNELLKSCTVYNEIASSQLTEEELSNG
jgi:ABC-type multidrug transport system fused ATPase/permease subunit